MKIMNIDIIKYRLEKSFNTFDEAIYCYEGNKYSACLNRLYYSAFYAVIALLLSNDITAKTHKGVRHQFVQNFVNERHISSDLSKLYSLLFDLRQENDYEDFNEIDVSIIPNLIERTKLFISKINELVTEIIQNQDL